MRIARGFMLMLAMCACTPARPAPPGAPPPWHGPPVATPPAAVPPAAVPSTPIGLLEVIARDIEALKPGFPQLGGFDPRRHLDRAAVAIQYEWSVHPPAPGGGGWTGAVPNPNPDGVWLYIDVHDPGSMAQIHSQPAVRKLRVWDKRLMMLLLEGEQTRSLSQILGSVLERRSREANDSGAR